MRRVLLAVLLVTIFVVGGVSLFRQQQKVAPVYTQQPTETTEAETNTPLASPSFNKEAIEQAVSTWAAQYGQAAGVVVAEVDGKLLASHAPDKEFFAASIYKLYLAYLWYAQIDRGDVRPEEPYLSGQTRVACLDVMIRNSDSPCAEKLWNEYGKTKATTDLEALGLTQTNMETLTTTASDAAKLLSLIENEQNLSSSSRTALKNSMREQIYTATFNQVFTSQIVYNKIGFRDYDEYHDVAIIEFADGRKLLIAALTNGVGTAGIRQLGELLLAAVQ